jgi:hypothetical protein
MSTFGLSLRSSEPPATPASSNAVCKRPTAISQLGVGVHETNSSSTVESPDRKPSVSGIDSKNSKWG